MDATPARMNESTTAGPEFKAATVPVRTKIPVPMIAPMPSIVRLSAPRARFRLWSVSASACRSVTLFRRNRFMRTPFAKGDESTARDAPRFARAGDLSIETGVSVRRSVAHLHAQGPRTRYRHGSKVANQCRSADRRNAVATRLRIGAGILGPGPKVPAADNDCRVASPQRCGHGWRKIKRKGDL